MFFTEREKVRKVAEILQRQSCAYDMAFFQGGDCKHKPPQICDCKYGYAGGKTMGEQTGCPELRCVVHLLSVITDEEYDSFMSRKGNYKI